MNPKVKIHSERVLLDDVFRVEEAYLTYTLENGRMSEPVRRLNLERGDSVAALVINRDTRTCVLAEQFRFPAYRRGVGWLLEIPAGIVEQGENPETAMRREILEEIGYRVDVLEYITEFFPSPGGSSERIKLYCAIVSDENKVSPGGGNEAEQEAIEVRKLPLSQIEQYMADGRIKDGKTVVALTWLQLRLASGDILEGSENA